MRREIGIVLLMFLMCFTACGVTAGVNEMMESNEERSTSTTQVEELALEELLELVAESSKQNRYCAVRYEMNTKQYDLEEKRFMEKNEHGEIKAGVPTEYSSYMEARLAELYNYDDVSVKVEIDDTTIPNKAYYRVNVAYQNDGRDCTEDFFVDADTKLLMGVMMKVPENPEQGYMVYKTLYSDNPYVTRKY